MDMTDKLIAVAIVHVVYAALFELSHRRYPILDKKHQSGMYLILMPLGFGALGFDVSFTFVLVLVVLGVWDLLGAISKQMARVRVEHVGS